MNLNHQLCTGDFTKEAVIDMLQHFASVDNDFNGENGEEYLWDDLFDDNGNPLYHSNLAYVLEQIQEHDEIVPMIEDFFEMWMGQDNYYKEYSVEYSIVEGKISISVAYTKED